MEANRTLYIRIRLPWCHNLVLTTNSPPTHLRFLPCQRPHALSLYSERIIINIKEILSTNRLSFLPRCWRMDCTAFLIWMAPIIIKDRLNNFYCILPALDLYSSLLLSTHFSSILGLLKKIWWMSLPPFLLLIMTLTGNERANCNKTACTFNQTPIMLFLWFIISKFSEGILNM